MKTELRTEFRGREVTGQAADRLRLEASVGMEVTRILASRERVPRHDAPDRASIRRAIEAVEDRIVEALWTLARLPEGRRPDGPSKHGLEYVQDKADRWANAVANEGWETQPPRPPLPSAKAIDAMVEPLEWLSLLARDQGRLVCVAAATKRGDTKRRVSWARVRQSMPELGGYGLRTLQRRYEDGLRMIVAELAGRGI